MTAKESKFISDPFSRITPPELEIFFKEIPIDESHSYKIRMMNINRFRISRHCRDYIIFQSKLLDGFDKLNINLDTFYLFHFPLKAFKMAWKKSKNYREFDPKEIIDCDMTFKRPNGRIMEITETRFIEMIHPDNVDEQTNKEDEII